MLTVGAWGSWSVGGLRASDSVWGVGLVGLGGLVG